jgi:hypothetical protein
MDDSGLILLADAIKVAYNAAIAMEYSMCDEAFRQILLVTFDPDLNARRVKNKSGGGTERVRRRQVEEGGSSFMFTVKGACESCTPETDFFDVISKDLFLALVTPGIGKKFA